MKALITGGAGFIGVNLAHRLIGRGNAVTIYDNLSRRGSDRNVAWLQETHGPDGFHLIQADLCDYPALVEAARGVDAIYHLAGQFVHPIDVPVEDAMRSIISCGAGSSKLIEAYAKRMES